MIYCLRTGAPVFIRRSDARKTAAGIFRRRLRVNQLVYRCSYCSLYHIGRPPL